MNHAICNNIDYFLKHVKTHFHSDQEYLEELFKLVHHDIDINFDSKHFYMIQYKYMNTHKLYFPVNEEDTPLEILEAVWAQ